MVILGMRKTVAIVDDDLASLTALAALVEALGHEPVCFSDPLAFLASDMPRKVDVLLADVRLPGCSGIALNQRLVESGVALPCVLVTAYPDPASRQRALAAGLHGYLAKPVDPEQLLSCLLRATAHPQAE
jgi:FixJ family two-component response regulator